MRLNRLPSEGPCPMSRFARSRFRVHGPKTAAVMISLIAIALPGWSCDSDEDASTDASTATTDTQTANSTNAQDSPPMSHDESEHASHTHTNRLVNETSPYLLQHAHNPVNWYPWGEEAFEAARAAQKPIFLSIGYSTCYWCHVMERESFENEEIAAVMNEHFICIKVDREERPDVDDIYMHAVQLLTQHGGWPMSVFLTPPPPTDVDPAHAWVGLEPFYGGTYFPPEDRYGRPGFPTLLNAINDGWTNQHAQVIEQATRVAEAVRQQLGAPRQPASIGADQVAQAAGQLLQIFDSTHAGFGSAPKFPQPVYLEFLMEIRDGTTDATQQQAVDSAISLTLDKMAMGGMYDQVGGGFHRYSTDAEWLVPHFEKMLYDNGQLASLYSRAAEMTDNAYWGEIASEICDYVLREMVGDNGAFYSAQDAEVNHREGQNYLWTSDSVTETLTAAGRSDLVDFALDAYGLRAGTNFRDPHHQDDPPANVIFLTMHPQRLADTMSLSLDVVNRQLREVNEVLLVERDTRDQPGTDDKVVVAWNGLMIAGMADAGRVLGRPDFVAAAKNAWVFIDNSMRDGDGHLLRTSRAGESKISGFSEDYAMVILGLLSLHEATDDRTYLDAAVSLTDDLNTRFRDSDGGAYYDTLPDQPDLFVRSRSTYDGAIPCANSVMLNNLVALHARTGEMRFLNDALLVLADMSSTIRSNPVGTVNATRALNRMLTLVPTEIAAIGAGEPSLAENGARPRSPVAVDVSTDVIQLSRVDGPVSFEVALTIEDGFHVNAHDPGDASLIGLDVALADAGDAYSIDVTYPEGESFTMGDQPILVHTNEIKVPVSIATQGEIKTGPVRLVVTYQVCTDSECLAPVRQIVVLAVE